MICPHETTIPSASVQTRPTHQLFSLYVYDLLILHTFARNILPSARICHNWLVTLAISNRLYPISPFLTSCQRFEWYRIGKHFILLTNLFCVSLIGILRRYCGGEHVRCVSKKLSNLSRNSCTRNET